MVLDSLLSETYGGSTIAQYVVFFAVLTVGAVVGQALSFLIERRLKRTARATETAIDDIIVDSLGGPIALVGVVVTGYLGQGVLTPTATAAPVLSAVIDIALIVAIAWITIRLTDGLIGTYIGEYADHSESRLDDALVPIVNRMTNLAILAIAVIVILDTVGYDVTAIIASVGIGGIALAFAARRTLSDVFGGAHILSTKPFLVGDDVEVDGIAGTVEEIGLRCTTIRDWDGRLVTVPNSTVAEAAVTNISSEPTRRVKTILELPHDLDAGAMATALELLERSVNGVDGVDVERTGAWFWGYGESGKQVRLDYHIGEIDRWKDVRDAVNAAIQTAMDEAGLEMGLPSRSIRLEDGPGPESPAAPTGVEGSD